MPARPKLAAASAREVRFPSFDELAADAAQDSPSDPYLLPIKNAAGKETVIEITLDGDRFLSLTSARLRGDYESMYNALFPDSGDRALVRLAFKKAPLLMVDRLVGNVLSYFYGNGLQIEADKGNSPAS